MKNLKLILSFIIVVLLYGCASEDSLIDINSDIPTNISALITIKQDNSGKVTITPTGEGVTNYQVYFGDGTIAATAVNPGDSAFHTYLEGVYPVKIVGTTLDGKRSEIIQNLTVSFLPPTNLIVTIAQVAGNNFQISVKAKANLETFFKVTFGDVPNEVPVSFIEDQIITHNYATTGSYTVTVVALSGGAATTTYSQIITINDPIVLPVDFQSSTINYAFTNFGGAATIVANNPAIGAANMSTRVAKTNKSSGAETFAGSFFELGSPIDFTALQKIKMKVWSPQAGIVLKMKLENLANSTINIEANSTTTVSNAWQEVTFDFTGINSGNSYQRIVIFFNFGVAGTGLDYYFDDIQLTSGVPTISLPIDFESSVIPYTFIDFGGNTASIINNPNAAGINTSAKVGKIVKGNAALIYAGSVITLGNPINFTTMQKLKIKVWSPQSGTVVKIKLENLTNSSLSTELDVTTTTANTWEELTYNFTGIVNGNNYQKVIVFFDFGNVGSGKTYYFDDIKQSN